MACVVCGGERLIRLVMFHVPSRYDGKDYPLYRCATCGLVRPVPLTYTEETKYDVYDDEGITKCYDPATKRVMFGSREYRDYFKNFEGYRGYIEKLGIKGRHLDVGCGSGHLMTISREMGLKPEGVELNAGILAAMREAGFTVHDREICDPYYEAGSFDLVTMNHVMEHIAEPGVFTGCINRITKEGGHVIMAFPYIYGIMPRLLRSRWYGHGSGQHLNFFSKESITMLLNKSGFEVVDIKAESMDYAPLCLPEPIRAVIDLACRGIAALGLGDNLFVVARKVRQAG